MAVRAFKSVCAVCIECANGCVAPFVVRFVNGHCSHSHGRVNFTAKKEPNRDVQYSSRQKKEIPERIHLEVRGAANERLITLGGCGVSSIFGRAVGRRAVIFRHFHRRYLALISFGPSLLFLHIRLANPQSSRLSHWQRFERHCIASYVLSIFYSIPWSCLFNR